MMMIRSMTAKRLVKGLKSFAASKVVKVKPRIEESVMATLPTMTCFSTMTQQMTENKWTCNETLVLLLHTRKHPLLSDNAVGRRQRQKKFIDLNDVPPQLPIKSSRKNGSSKYVGVTKAMKKWAAKVNIDGKVRFIGSYDNEEKAAIDYARVKFKYKEDHHRPYPFPKKWRRGIVKR